MKNTVPTLTFLLALILTTVGIKSINLVLANPFSQSRYSGEKYGVDATPPTVTIRSPENSGLYNVRNITLNINVSTRESKTTQGGFRMTTAIGIDKINYVTDWQQNSTLIFSSPDMEDLKNNLTKYYYMGQFYDNYSSLPEINFENISLTLTNVPDGNHTIYVLAEGEGSDYYIFNWYIFHVTGIAKAQFTVKATAPKILFTSFEQTVYTTSEIPLNFTINEPTSQISYTLDRQTNVTINGNTTLTRLANGRHNITVYAIDEAGNIGASETLYFNVAVSIPFTTWPVIVSATISVAGIVGVLVYWKKHKQ